MTRLGTCLLTACIVLLLPASASAGGWWTTLGLHNQYLGAGERLTVKIDEVFFVSTQQAEIAAETPYYAYLVKGFDHRLLERAMNKPEPERWWRPLTPPIKAGDVYLGGADANLMRGRVHLNVPDVPPGRYALMLCDDGCHTPLGNHIPVRVHITSDSFAARTARQLDNANERMKVALARIQRNLRQTRREFERVEAQSRASMDAGRSVDEKTRRTETQTSPAWIPYAG